MIVSIPIDTSRDAPKAPPVGLPNKTGKFGMGKVLGNDAGFEFAGLEDPPTASVGHPGDNVREIGAIENAVHERGKVGRPASTRQWCLGSGVDQCRVVSVVKVWIRLASRRFVAGFVFLFVTDVTVTDFATGAVGSSLGSR